MHPPEYVAARRALLDVLETLTTHRDAITIVGAQAVYMWTGPAEIAVPEMTTDADLALDPELLGSEPEIAATLEAAAFTYRDNPGLWSSAAGVAVDLLVPEALAGSGRRSASIPPHDPRTARRARGLEAALVDRSLVMVSSLDDADERRAEVHVAGPAALLVAKAIKISERVDGSRLVDKDALDALRLLQAIPTAELATTISSLATHEIAGPVTQDAVALLRDLALGRGAVMPEMVRRAVGPFGQADVAGASLVALVDQLLAAAQ